MVDPGDKFSRVASVFLNPALLRDVEQNTDATTPLTTRASQYGLWRLRHGTVRAVPLVGNSGVAGTICLVTSQANSGHAPATTFDTVAARRHVSGGVGRELKFDIGPKDAKGPQHGWYFTNTATGPGQDTLGPSVEVYTLGASKNIYTNQNFTGPLWRLTFSATFEFANYQNNPNLADMQSAEATSAVTVTTDASGEVTVTPGNSALRLRAPATPGLGDVVLSLTESVSQGLENIPLLGPLLRTGVAFLRPFLSSVRAPAGYKLYPNFEAARLNQPLRLTPNQHHEASGRFVVQQLTPAQNQVGVSRSVGPIPIGPEMPSSDYETLPIPSGTPSDRPILWIAGSLLDAQPTRIVPSTTAFNTTSNFKGAQGYWPTGAYSGNASSKWQFPGASTDHVYRFGLVPEDATATAAQGVVGSRAREAGDGGILSTFRHLAAAVPEASGDRGFGWRHSNNYPLTASAKTSAKLIPVEVTPHVWVAEQKQNVPNLAGYLVSFHGRHLALDLVVPNSREGDTKLWNAFSGYVFPDYGFIRSVTRTGDEEEIEPEEPCDPWTHFDDLSTDSGRSTSSSILFESDGE